MYPSSGRGHDLPQQGKSNIPAAVGANIYPTGVRAAAQQGQISTPARARAEANIYPSRGKSNPSAGATVYPRRGRSKPSLGAGQISTLTRARATH